MDDAKTVDPEELKSAIEFTEQVIDEFYPKPGTLLGYEPEWNKAKGKIVFRPLMKKMESSLLTMNI